MKDNPENNAPSAVHLAERRGAVLWLTINRPEKHNALNRAVLGAIGEVFSAHATDGDLKAAVITGAGAKYFSAGGDLHELRTMKTADEARAFSFKTRAHFDAVRDFPVPVVAALNGDALGGGSELALACDFRVVAAGARFGFVQGRIAVGTGWGGGIDLMDVVGPVRAHRLMSRAEYVEGPEALAMGLVDAVGAQGQDMAGLTDGFLEPILALTRPALCAFKKMARAGRRGVGRNELAALETELFTELWVHDDHWAALERVMPAKPARGARPPPPGPLKSNR